MSSAPIIPPDLHVVAGAPDDDELAALVAGLHVVSQSSASDTDTEVSPPSVWISRGRSSQRTFTPGPHSWRWRDH
ncbi:MAG: acyl-CoA carboxylase subunit epsilon [Bowdeniella nasicola]|nr:acyl-CoA carboxylase subunit epsilon [Bowdeniella nasicola]